MQARAPQARGAVGENRIAIVAAIVVAGHPDRGGRGGGPATAAAWGPRTAFKLTAAEAEPHHTYFDGKRKPKVSYVFQRRRGHRRPRRGRRPDDEGSS